MNKENWNPIPDIDIIDLDDENLDTADSRSHSGEHQKKLENDIPRGKKDEEFYSPEDEISYEDIDNDSYADDGQEFYSNEGRDSFADEGEEFYEENEYYEDEESLPPKKGIRSFLNVHVALIAVFLIFIVCLVVKFSTWGERINQSDIVKDDPGEYLDVLDEFLPLTDENGKAIPTGAAKTIVAFGNAPFADDRDSSDNLANLIADASGATVYNCSVSGSYLAAQEAAFSSSDAPMDAYCFYWLVVLATMGDNSYYYEEAANVLGDALPPEAQQVYDTLTTLDFNTVDVVTVMYDATDYLLGHEMYDDNNSTNIQQFTGDLEAGIELLQSIYPNIRIIVMSPTYAYAVDENGNYVSSDIYTYGQDVLSTYSIKEYASCSSRSVSFIDNLYGTITEDNAKNYLVDNLHLNVAGRKLVCNRFMDALNAYNNDSSAEAGTSTGTVN